MEVPIGDKVVAKIHHVVFNFSCPVGPQSIFSADAKHPSADRPFRRSAGYHTTGENHATGEGIDAGHSIDFDVRPGTTYFAVDEPTIEGPASPRSKRGNPVDSRFGAHKSECKPRHSDVHRNGVFYARPRNLPFNTEHPLGNLVIEPGLTAADKAAGPAAASPTSTDVTADVEPGPVIKRDQRRSPVERSSYDIGGISHCWRRYQRRRNNADLQEPERAHEIAPSCGQKGT